MMAPMRILIVDDHELIRRGLRHILDERPNWEICGEAVNGQEAIRLAAEFRPDVIVMDIAMPIMNGLEATEHLNRNGCKAKIVILTMFDIQNMVARARQIGAHGYVAKSEAALRLIDTIEEVLGGANETFRR